MYQENHGDDHCRGPAELPHPPDVTHDNTTNTTNRARSRHTAGNRHRPPHGVSEPKKGAAPELQLGRGVSAHMDTAGTTTVVPSSLRALVTEFADEVRL